MDFKKNISYNMKYLLILFTILVCAACDSSKKKMQIEIRKYVDANFKDPKSYQEVDFKITDTIFIKDILRNEKSNLEYFTSQLKDFTDETKYEDSNEIISNISKNIELDNEEDINAALDKAQKQIEKSRKVLYSGELEEYKLIIKTTEANIKHLSSLDTNGIYNIICINKYRAKNGFGALDLFQAELIFNDSLRLISFKADKE